jgi:hypothetical protein
MNILIDYSLKDIRKCTPALFYLVIYLISTITTLFTNPGNIPINLLSGWLHTLLYTWLCSTNRTNTAWILVILPIVLVIIMMLKVGKLVAASTKYTKRCAV